MNTNAGGSSEGRASKSAAKREAKAIEELAQWLIDLPIERRRALPIDPALIDHAEFAATRSKGAARRERLSIAKRLRKDVDAVAILDTARAATQQHSASERAQFRQVEQLRDQLLDERNDARALVHDAGFDEATAAAVLSAVDAYRRAGSERDRKRFGRDVFRQVRDAMADQLGVRG
ncbi:MAG: DUF615 domain-containing protein [Pseudomonadota bacterium]